MGIYNSGTGVASEDNNAYVSSLGRSQVPRYSGMGGSYGLSDAARRAGIMPGVNPSGARFGVQGAAGRGLRGMGGAPLSASPYFQFEKERRGGMGVRSGAMPPMSAVAMARMQRPNQPIDPSDPKNAALAGYR